MKSTLRDQMINTIRNYGLLCQNDSVLVAVSGGADSVCLLSLLMSIKDEWNLTISVAHLNHMLRGDEADRDEAFVRNLCKEYGVSFHCQKCDVRRIASEQRCSLEEAGRNVRYAFFTTIQKQERIDKIATAHNRNDNVETVFMRFIRGTSLRGLSGIPIKNDSGVIRPLLFAERQAIEDYLKMHNLPFVTDSTNNENDYTRNKIRNCLIPYICSELNHNFVNTLSENLELYKETESFLAKSTKTAYDSYVQQTEYGASMRTKDFIASDKIVILRLIQKIVQEITCCSATNDMIRLIYQMVLQKKHSRLDVHQKLTMYVCYGKIHFVNPDFLSDIQYTLSIDKTHKVPTHSRNALYLPESIDINKLHIRKRKPGDKMYLGKCGHKKIKDILIDEKVPVFLRDTIPVVLYENEIIWLCGIRDNPSFRASTSDSCYKITYTKENNHA